MKYVHVLDAVQVLFFVSVPSMKMYPWLQIMFNVLKYNKLIEPETSDALDTERFVEGSPHKITLGNMNNKISYKNAAKEYGSKILVPQINIKIVEVYSFKILYENILMCNLDINNYYSFSN